MVEIYHAFLGMREELTNGLKLFVRYEVECVCVHVGLAAERVRNRLKIVLKETSKIKEYRSVCGIVFRRRVV